MLSERMVRGSNFVGFHAGPMAEWKQYRLEPPEVPVPARGKLFLKKLLDCAGLEISMNVLPPGKAIPFLHRHEQNDETYIVLGGKGQFLIDGECIDVGEGSVLRLSPQAARAWRNNSDAPLYFLCLQHRADSVVECGTRDGRRVDAEPVWPD